MTARTFGGTPEELEARSAELKKSLSETQMKIYTDALTKAQADAAKKKEVIRAHTEMISRGLVSAMMSEDVGAAAKALGIQIAEEMMALLLARAAEQIILSMMFPGAGRVAFQETGHIPAGASAGGIPALVHPGEYILHEAQLHALQAGLGIAGGKGKFAYEVPPAPPSVDVHVYPGADVEVKTALRARAGEMRLAQLEA
jgi:hypothetical protein